MTWHLCKREKCDQLTSNAKYCSRSCASSVNNQLITRRKKKPQPRTCVCGSHFDFRASHSRLCPTCWIVRHEERQSYDLRTLGFFVTKNGGNHPSWKFAEVRGHCRSINGHLQKMCQVCGYATHIEYAHIIALSKWPLTTTLREVNDETNIVVLCRNHHWEFDHGVISLNDIPLRS